MRTTSEKFAGSTAMDQFRRRRRSALREAWRDWAILCLLLGAALVTVVVADGTLQVVAAWVAGFATAVAAAGWIMGGHASSLPWMWGAAGERQTAALLARLPAGWHVAHDIADGRGNWDHVVIGPTGIYVIDTKTYNGEVSVADDTLRSGRMRTSGGTFRGQAVRLREALQSETEPMPWVQAVVAIWGYFPQGIVEDPKVVYLDATRLVEWLRSRPVSLTAERVERLAMAPILRHRNRATG
jgi:hypothetical protein